MIARSSPASSNVHPRFDFAPWTTALQVWLVLGGLALICSPELRGTDPWFGWLPFWLIVAPAIDLAVLRRRWLLDHARGGFGRALQWRRALRPQATSSRRRPRATRRGARGLPATAAVQSVMPRRLRSMRRRNSPMMRR